MLTLATLAAAAFLGPELKSAPNLNPRDFPSEIQRANASVFAEFELIIDPEGKTESCNVLSVIGDERFAGSICDLFSRKLEWNASRDSQGHPVYGRVRTSFALATGRSKAAKEVQQARLAPDVSLGMPEGGGNEASIAVPLSVLVSEDGKAEACKSQPDPGAAEPAPALVEAACGALEGKDFAPIMTAQGPIQRYATTQLAIFEAS